MRRSAGRTPCAEAAAKVAFWGWKPERSCLESIVALFDYPDSPVDSARWQAVPADSLRGEHVWRGAP